MTTFASADLQSDTDYKINMILLAQVTSRAVLTIKTIILVTSSLNAIQLPERLVMLERGCIYSTPLIKNFTKISRKTFNEPVVRTLGSQSKGFNLNDSCQNLLIFWLINVFSNLTLYLKLNLVKITKEITCWIHFGLSKFWHVLSGFMFSDGQILMIFQENNPCSLNMYHLYMF